MITQNELKQLIHYDPDTGAFVWLTNNKGKTAGCAALHKDSGKTYILIRVNYSLYKAHRLAFLYMTGQMPTDEVDHINGDGSDNRWCNLREVTRIENGRNMRLQSNNKSGLPGVHWDKSRCKWMCYIKLNNKRVNLGRHQDFFEAVCVRKSAELRYGFHKNHGSIRPL